ncbi:MAG: hypothetical protein MJE68_02890, partial [Proteobacteria bacterium]|nr:hypothetical protein [Pseudomonadota bacterium]
LPLSSLLYLSLSLPPSLPLSSTVVMAPVVVGMVVITLVPLILSTTMGYCVTGYIRDVLFQRTVKQYIGSLCCNATVS